MAKRKTSKKVTKKAKSKTSFRKGESKELRLLKEKMAKMQVAIDKALREKKALLATLIVPATKKEGRKVAAARRRFEREVEKLIEQEMFFQDFVDAETLDRLHFDGTVAVMSSILRHDARQPKWSKRLHKAWESGDMEAAVASIAKEADATLQEVYTLFFSL